MLSSIPDYQHKYQSTICNLNLSLASGVPMTFFNIQKCHVIKKRQNIWKVSKKNSVFLYVFISTSVFYQWESYSARIEILIWNLPIRHQKKCSYFSSKHAKNTLWCKLIKTNVCRGALTHWVWDVERTSPERLRRSEDVRLTPCACWVADCKVTKKSVKSPNFISVFIRGICV